MIRRDWIRQDMTRQTFIDQIEKQALEIYNKLRSRASVKAPKITDIVITIPSVPEFAQKLSPKPNKIDLTKQDSVLDLARKVR